MRARLALALMLAAAPVAARDIEITRACLPGFCLESRTVFTVIRREPAAGKYRLLLSEAQSVLYIEAGPDPAFPACGACGIETRLGERMALQERTGRVMGRLVGPIEGCAGAPAFYVHLFVYLPLADPARFRVVRHC